MKGYIRPKRGYIKPVMHKVIQKRGMIKKMMHKTGH